MYSLALVTKKSFMKVGKALLFIPASCWLKGCRHSYVNKHAQELLQFNYRVDIHSLNIHILSSERETSVSSHSTIWTETAHSTNTRKHATNCHVCGVSPP